jgi:uncharacterized protein (DUF1778 family)
MPKKLTITVSNDVYDGLYRHVGPRRIGRFLEELARPHVTSMDLERAYRDAAQDEVAEAVIERAQHLALSERESLRVLELLETPPAPNARLIKAAKAGQTLK